MHSRLRWRIRSLPAVLPLQPDHATNRLFVALDLQNLVRITHLPLAHAALVSCLMRVEAQAKAARWEATSSASSGDASTSINQSSAACGLLVRRIYPNLRLAGCSCRGGCIVWKKTAKKDTGISSRRVASRLKQRHMSVISIARLDPNIPRPAHRRAAPPSSSRPRA